MLESLELTIMTRLEHNVDARPTYVQCRRAPDRPHVARVTSTILVMNAVTPVCLQESVPCNQRLPYLVRGRQSHAIRAKCMCFSFLCDFISKSRLAAWPVPSWPGLDRCRFPTPQKSCMQVGIA